MKEWIALWVSLGIMALFVLLNIVMWVGGIALTVWLVILVLKFMSIL